MMGQRIPPMAAINGLELFPQDPESTLTELEGALISKNLLFSKIYQLRKSRWTALKDKIIKIPLIHISNNSCPIFDHCGTPTELFYVL